MDEDANHTTKFSKELLHDMVYYCLNDVECRRVQILRYFGEIVPACAKESVNFLDFWTNQNRFCDNCAHCVSSQLIEP